MNRWCVSALCTLLVAPALAAEPRPAHLQGLLQQSTTDSPGDRIAHAVFDVTASPEARARAFADAGAAVQVPGEEDVLFLAARLSDGDPRHDALLARLRANEPDNLAVAMIALTPATLADPDAFDAWLHDAARLHEQNMHFAATVVRLVDLLARAPADDDVRAGARSLGPDATVEDALLVEAIGFWSAFVGPMADLALFRQCDPKQAPRWSPQRARDCARLAETLATRADTIVDRTIGYALWQHAVAGTAEAAAVMSAKQRFTDKRVAGIADADPAQQLAYGRALLAGLRAGRTEVEIMQAWAAAHGSGSATNGD